MQENQNPPTLPKKEARKTIALIDTGISPDFPNDYLCSEGHKDLTGQGIQDYRMHGSLVAYILAHYIDPKKSCIVVVKYWVAHSDMNTENYLRGLRYVSEQKFNYLNLSLSGNGILPYEKEYLQKILNNGTIVSNAAGNESTDLSKDCSAWPACYKMLQFVVASCKNGVLEPYSNFNGPVNACEYGTQEYAGIRMQGTSFSSPVHLGKYIKNHE